VKGKFGFLLRCCWWREVLWLLVEFGVAKELVECEVSNCTTIRFIFMVFLFFIGEMQLFWFAFKVSRVFLCVQIWMLCPISYVQALWRQSFTDWGHIYRNILVEDLQGFFASTQKNDAHVHELHIWHLHKIKTWVQVEISNIKFDTLFLEVKFLKFNL